MDYKLPFRGLLSVLLASTALSGSSLAQQPSGTAVRVDPNVDAAGPGGSRVLEVEGAVFMGDQIVSSPHGLAQIRFIDDTRIVVGPNSRLTIDTFVFNPDNTAREVTINALKGAFRFISGNSPSEAYSIRMPTMTLGMRGSAVDCAVRADNQGFCAALDGTITACDNVSNTCADFEENCSIFATNPNGELGRVEGRVDEQIAVNAYFPFIANPNLVDPEFRVDTTACASPDPRIFREPTDNEREPPGRQSPPSPGDDFDEDVVKDDDDDDTSDPYD